jgi:transcriptional regulator with XRE-family HTH domain
MTDFKEILRKNIKNNREALGLTQQELADQTGYQVSYISRIERKACNLTIEVISQFAAALSVSPADLLTANKFIKSKKDIEDFKKAARIITSLAAKLEE